MYMLGFSNREIQLLSFFFYVINIQYLDSVTKDSNKYLVTNSGWIQ